MAFDGLQGLRYLQERQYQIIILDLKLPGLNGYRVLESIRKTGKLLKVKVLVLSGRPLGDPLLKEDSFPQDEEKALKMADLVVSKPFMVEDFLKQVKALALSIVERRISD